MLVPLNDEPPTANRIAHTHTRKLEYDAYARVLTSWATAINRDGFAAYASSVTSRGRRPCQWKSWGWVSGALRLSASGTVKKEEVMGVSFGIIPSCKLLPGHTAHIGRVDEEADATFSLSRMHIDSVTFSDPVNSCRLHSSGGNRKHLSSHRLANDNAKARNIEERKRIRQIV